MPDYFSISGKIMCIMKQCSLVKEYVNLVQESFIVSAVLTTLHGLCNLQMLPIS
jgi:hypothetical protein